MKKILFVLIAIVGFNTLQAQQKPTELDKSPMDMCYLPKDYPILKMSGKSKDLPVARIIYGRPQKNDREIFGGIIKYGEIWRLGANEATEIELFKNVKFGNKILLKGRYTMFCIPTDSKWTLIFNKDNFSWGSFTYDAKKDVLRTDAVPVKGNETAEALTIYFEDTKAGANLIIQWDNTKAAFPFVVQ